MLWEAVRGVGLGLPSGNWAARTNSRWGSRLPCSFLSLPSPTPLCVEVSQPADTLPRKEQEQGVGQQPPVGCD